LVWRKWPYLKKLEPGAHRVGDSFFHDLSPELVDHLRSFSWRTMWRSVLVAADDTLGHVRAVFVRIDRASARMVKSLRRTHDTVEREQMKAEEQASEPEPKPVIDEAQTRRDAELTRLKQREQQLIVDISQDPKEISLYRELSSVYSRLGSKNDAVEALKAALKAEPENEELEQELKELES